MFVLFTRARFDLDGALLLASLYYLFVVVLEVPSGWASDRLGRVVTLRAAAIFWIGAQACFLFGDERFFVIAVGQLLLAGGFASLSGTDVTLHYDTLEAAGRADSYPDRQAKVSALGYVATAASALLGGLLGLVDLRLAFVASLGLAVAQFGVTLRLREPPHAAGDAESFYRQLRVCLGYLKQRYLGWLFLYGVILVTLVHVAFTLMQPWLTNVLDQTADDLGATPLLAGVVFAVTSLVGAVAARLSAPLTRRFGAPATLIGFAALSAVLVTAMAASTHIVIIAALAFRSAQGAAAPVVISAEVSPRVARGHRATVLSLNSLAGRLGYGLLLLFVAADSTDDVQRVLRTFSIISWSLVGLLLVSVLALRGDRASTERATTATSVSPRRST